MKKYLHFFYGKTSYSQEGEDLILKQIFKNKKKGFYCDLGCHHPVRFNNTFLLYKKGWNGLNVDASKSSIRFFNAFRKRDTNVHALISFEKNPTTKKYAIFNEGAVNGILSKKRINMLISKGYDLKRINEIQTYNVNSLFNSYLKKGEIFDFLKIDIEGLDFKVLKVIDFKKYLPGVIMIEKIENETEITQFLKGKGYTVIAMTPRNVIFIHNMY